MTRRKAITERDIRRAAAEHQVELDVKDAAVTPSAIDLARRLGLLLRGLPSELRSQRQTGKPIVTRGAPAAAAPTAGSTLPAEPVERSQAKADGGRRISCGADHGGVVLKDAIVVRLRELGHAVVDHGTNGTTAVDYPDFALQVARAVSSGAAELGIMVDGAGIGSCMVANKVRGVRAAMCYDVTTAQNAREHNNANVLTLGGGLIGTRLGLAIVEVFVSTPFGGGRHAARVAKIDELDGGRGTGDGGEPGRR